MTVRRRLSATNLPYVRFGHAYRAKGMVGPDACLFEDSPRVGPLQSLDGRSKYYVQQYRSRRDRGDRLQDTSSRSTLLRCVRLICQPSDRRQWRLIAALHWQ
jgi:hypothetical protein